MNSAVWYIFWATFLSSSFDFILMLNIMNHAISFKAVQWLLLNTFMVFSFANAYILYSQTTETLQDDEGLREAMEGVKYYYGMGLKIDKIKALQHFKKSATLGNPIGVYHYARYVLNGTFMLPDTAEANNLFVSCFENMKALAMSGNLQAQTDLGNMYNGAQGVERNDEEAAQWYRKAAEQGYARAQTNLGICYQEGTGVPKNDEEAARWYRKAAEQGEAYAQARLGDLYRNGTGVPKNDEEAARWYRKAAEQGEARAQTSLGLCYSNGTGVPKNDEEAAHWYRKAAEQGLAVAQYNTKLNYKLCMRFLYI